MHTKFVMHLGRRELRGAIIKQINIFNEKIKQNKMFNLDNVSKVEDRIHCECAINDRVNFIDN